MTMDTALEVTLNDGEYRIDSRLVARSLGIEHESFMRTNSIYQAKIEKLGLLRFEIGAVKQQGTRGTKYHKYALLNENQSVFLATLSRNTDQIVEFKLRLTQTFADVRARLAEESYQPQPSIHRYSQARLERLLPELRYPIPAGCFTVVSEAIRNIAVMEIILDTSSLDMGAYLELSIARDWATYCKDILNLPEGYRQQYTIMLPNRVLVHPWAYDLRYQTMFLQWLWNVYFPEKFPAYQRHRVRYIGLLVPKETHRKQLARSSVHQLTLL